MDFLSTPFDPTSVDLLESLGVPVYKIASPEITDIPLIELAASKQKPMIISTGMALLSDIEEAIQACNRVGNNDITLLKCTSSYPAPYEEANLLTIPNLASTFGVRSGLSDHTLGHAVAVAAVAPSVQQLLKSILFFREMFQAPTHLSHLLRLNSSNWLTEFASLKCQSERLLTSSQKKQKRIENLLALYLYLRISRPETFSLRKTLGLLDQEQDCLLNPLNQY